MKNIQNKKSAITKGIENNGFRTVNMTKIFGGEKTPPKQTTADIIANILPL